MTISVRTPDQAATSGVRRAARAGGDHAFSAHHGLGFAIGGASILDGLLIAVSAGVQYALARRR